MGRIRKTVPRKAVSPIDPKIQDERQRIAKHLVRQLRKAGYGCAFEESGIVKRSVLIAGHKTSISLEDPFWTDLKKIAQAQQMTLSALIADIDGTREQGNLSSAIRLFVLHHVHYGQRQMEEAKSRIRGDQQVLQVKAA